MNNRTYTLTQEGHEGQERAHATLFRAEGNRYNGSVTQPRMGKNDLLNESIKSIMHQEWATPMPTELCAQVTVDWRNPDASFNFLKLKIMKITKIKPVDRHTGQNREGNHRLGINNKTTALLHMVENRHFGFAPQKS